MNAIYMHMPVRLIRREGALSDCGALARRFGKCCLIITSGSAAEKSGALTDAMSSMKAAGVEAIVYPHISQNPSFAQCRAACDAYKAARAHSILAIGGGSVMDAAKAVAWMGSNYVPTSAALYDKELKRPPVPLMLCGTTAGTGSEVTAVAVITDERGQKRSIKHEHCFAHTVFADPRYTYSCPRSVTVSTALDALCHAAEGFLNPTCDDLSTTFAARALPLICRGLTALIGNDLPDHDTRNALFDGALYAGFVLNNCGTAFPHPFGYVLTEEHGIPHGQACAVFLSALLDRAAACAPDRAAELFALCGGEDALRTLLSKHVTVDVHMTTAQLDACAKRFADLPHYAHVPGGFDSDSATTLFRALFA